jgi:ATP-binding cassette subfamily F protein 3
MKIGQVMAGLGFEPSDADRPCAEFSGGWQMRIALARTLVEHADLMLLDEPTNYLDIEALTWLKNYLKVYKGGLLLVSHDQGSWMIRSTRCSSCLRKTETVRRQLHQYQAQREMEIKELEAKAKAQAELVGKTEQFIERFRYKATKSKQVQSRIKQLDKLEEIQVPGHLKQLEFSFPPPRIQETM